MKHVRGRRTLLVAAVAAGALLIGTAVAGGDASKPVTAGDVSGGIEYLLNGNAFSISDETGEIVSEPSTRLPYEDLVKPVDSTDPVRYEITATTGGFVGWLAPGLSEWSVERRTVENGKERVAEQVTSVTGTDFVEFVPSEPGKYYVRVSLSGTQVIDGPIIPGPTFELVHTVRYGEPEIPEWNFMVHDHEDYVDLDFEFSKNQYSEMSQVTQSQDAALAAGFGAVLLDLDMSLTNDVEGRYEFGLRDDVVQGLIERGIELFPNLIGTPRWASSGDTESTNYRDWAAAPAADMSVIADYTAIVIERYGEAIPVLSPWNEPNYNGPEVDPEGIGPNWTGTLDQLVEHMSTCS